MSVAESIANSSKETKDLWLENARLKLGLPPWSNSKISKPATAALMAIGLLGAGASGALLNNWIGGSDNDADPPQQTQNQVVERERGSLLQYLEDSGYHLPPK